MMLDHRARDRWTLAWMIDAGVLQGVLGAAIGLILTFFLQVRGLVPGGLLVLVAGMAAGFGILMGITRAVGNASARAAGAIYSPSGSTTGYVPSFSHIEALTIRGALDEAAEAWTAAMAEQPASMVVAVRAADFHLRERRDQAQALRLYLHARSLAAQAVAGTDSRDLQRYIQQKLVDLYLEGPTADQGRAMVELRRLADSFPGTPEADGARASLLNLKSERESGKTD
jgi:hypothetical protein